MPKTDTQENIISLSHSSWLEEMHSSELPLYVADMYGCYPSFDHPLEDVGEEEIPSP